MVPAPSFYAPSPKNEVGLVLQCGFVPFPSLFALSFLPSLRSFRVFCLFVCLFLSFFLSFFFLCFLFVCLFVYLFLSFFLFCLFSVCLFVCLFLSFFFVCFLFVCFFLSFFFVCLFVSLCFFLSLFLFRLFVCLFVFKKPTPLFRYNSRYLLNCSRRWNLIGTHRTNSNQSATIGNGNFPLWNIPVTNVPFDSIEKWSKSKYIG